MADISRFRLAQDGEAPVELSGATYDKAIMELAVGKKTSHWMWYVFPQAPFGRSGMSSYYAIKSMDEAVSYLEDPILSSRYAQCLDLVSAKVISEPNQDGDVWRRLTTLFGSIDNRKFKSSVSLFESAAFTSELPQFQVVANAISTFRLAGLRHCKSTTEWVAVQAK